MSTDSRLSKLEKYKKAMESITHTIHVIRKDPVDPDYIIIDPYGKNPIRKLKAEHEAENAALERAGEQVIIIQYVDKSRE